MKGFSIGIVGITGLVGEQFLKILEKSDIKFNELRFFASESSENKQILFRNTPYNIKTVNKNSLFGLDFVFLFTSASLSKAYAKIAIKSGAKVIDNSSAFRMLNSVPLIIPEINFEHYDKQQLIANPNCSTIIALLPIFAVMKKYPIEQINFTTLQSVSGSGKKGIEALNCDNGFYNCDIRSTCIPQIGNIKKSGYSEEELKMIYETKKIFNNPDLKITSTCIRVPVKNCHGICVYLQLSRSFRLDYIKKSLKNSEQVVFCDDSDKLPNSLKVTGDSRVYVCRLRRAGGIKNALLFYVLGDNLTRGASYNAYVIMKKIIEHDCL